MLKVLCNFRKNKKGFTLIELLIVVAIIAILAAIAIPQFGSYRKRGYNAAANSDLRNIRTTEEAMMADFAEYGASNATIGGAGAASAAGGTVTLSGGKSSSANQSVSLSPGVQAAVESSENTSGTARPDYVAITGHSNGDNYYGADSDTTKLYRKGFSTYAAADLISITPTDDTDDLAAASASNWVQMQ